MADCTELGLQIEAGPREAIVYRKGPAMLESRQGRSQSAQMPEIKRMPRASG